MLIRSITGNLMLFAVSSLEGQYGARGQGGLHCACHDLASLARNATRPAPKGGGNSPGLLLQQLRCDGCRSLCRPCQPAAARRGKRRAHSARHGAFWG